MIKHWLGKLFKIQAEIDALQIELNELSWDETFAYASGIWHKQHTSIYDLVDQLSTRVSAEKQLHSMRKGESIHEPKEL